MHRNCGYEKSINKNQIHAKEICIYLTHISRSFLFFRLILTTRSRHTFSGNRIKMDLVFETNIVFEIKQSGFYANEFIHSFMVTATDKAPNMFRMFQFFIFLRNYLRSSRLL